jgi:phosphoribosylanthranilate isomerase
MCCFYSEDKGKGEGIYLALTMRKIRLKICGLRSGENIRDILPFNPDYIGFIFYDRSPRYVGENYSWIGDLDTGPAVRKVGVFVNETVEKMLKIAGASGIEYFQLHGEERPDTCVTLKENGLRIIKVFSAGKDFSFKDMEAYSGVVDYFLFDTRGKYLGGNGIPFDWSLLEKYPYQVPFFLSGGIGIDNISHVKFLSHPMLYAVDVNSRLESEPGIKDPDLLKRFMEEFEIINHD